MFAPCAVIILFCLASANLRAATLELHLEASEFGGATVGDPVPIWSDSSGNSRDAVQPTEASQPFVAFTDTGAGVAPVVQFDGSRTMDAATYVPSRGDYTLLVVAAVDAASGSTAAFLSQDVGGWNDLDTLFGMGTQNQFLAPRQTLALETHGPATGTFNGAATSNTIADGAFRVYWARVSGTEYTVGINSLSSTSTSSQAGIFGSDGAKPLEIGSSFGGGDGLNGAMAEVQIWSGAMSDLDLAAAISGLVNDYGLDGSTGSPQPISPSSTVVAANILSAGAAYSVPAGQTTTPAMTINSPANTGDVAIGVGGANITATQGVLMASVRQNYTGTSSHNDFTVEVVPEGAFSTQTHQFGGSLYGDMSLAMFNTASGTNEANINMSAAFFPFAQGWKAGHVRFNGSLLPHSYNGVTAENVARLDAETGKFLRYEVSIPGVEDSTQDGILLTVSNTNTGYTAPNYPLGGDKWEVVVRDNNDNFTTTREADFSFVYLPFDAPNLIAGRIGDDGGILAGTDGYTVEQTGGTGVYRITIPGETGDTGTLLIGHTIPATSGGITAPEDNHITYEYDESLGAFIVRSYDAPNDSPQSRGFTFAFINFENPPLVPIPEPSSLALAAVGLACFVRRMRRRNS
jgi:hypothetical protein